MITIRAATPADASMIASLLAQLGYPVVADDIPHRLARVADDHGLVLVALDGDERVVGVTSATRFAALHADADVAYITALVTDASARGQGIGRALVGALEEWARELGCLRLTVTSAEHRADAHEFYPRIGFPYTGRRFSKRLT